MSHTANREELGAHLERVRKAVGLTLREVEERTKNVVKNGYLSQIEKGAITRPSPAILYELAQVYDIAYRDLLIRAGHRVPEDEIDPDRLAIAGLPLQAIAELDEEDRQTLLEYVAFLRQRKKGRKHR